MTDDSEKPKIALVLGSGGARGLAHIGVLRAIEDSDYEIASISGCSVGALIGGIYAAGKLDAFEEWVSSVSKLDIVKLLDFSFEERGIVKGEKLMAELIDLVGNEAIEDFDVPFTAIATNVGTGKEVWLNSGPVFDAIRASIALPLFFTPVPYKNSWLIDGGVLNPVPIAPAFNNRSDSILAVNLSGEPVDDPDALLGVETSDSDDEEESSTFKDKLSDLIDSVADSVTRAKGNWGMYDIANQAFDAMQETIARQKLASYPPDYTITIPRNACGMLEFDRSKALIALGQEKAQEALRALSQYSRPADASRC